MACLQKIPRIIITGDFLEAHSDLRDVSYFLWQNKCSNLKFARHIKQEFFPKM